MIIKKKKMNEKKNLRLCCDWKMDGDEEGGMSKSVLRLN
jgi:hypothetical protein